jgi:hypothetical protein
MLYGFIELMTKLDSQLSEASMRTVSSNPGYVNGGETAVEPIHLIPELQQRLGTTEVYHIY